MSGGSWDYAYSRFEDVAMRLAGSTSVKRRALSVKVRDVAAAMKAIEWNDSGDGASDEPALIMVALGGSADVAMRAAVRSMLEDLRVEIEGLDEQAR